MAAGAGRRFDHSPPRSVDGRWRPVAGRAARVAGRRRRGARRSRRAWRARRQSLGANATTAASTPPKRPRADAKAPAALAARAATWDGIARARPCRRQRRDHAARKAQSGAGRATCSRRSAIRSRASWSNGRSCAATTTSVDCAATSPSSPPIRPGRASACCAAAPRRRCGAERLDPATCGPSSARTGRSRPRESLALARALLAAGRPRRRAEPGARGLAQRQFLRRRREARCSTSCEVLITDADHKARMDMRLYAEDNEGALRSAQPRRRQGAHRQGARRGDQQARRTPRSCSTPCRPRRAATSATSSAAPSGCAAPTRAPRPPS